MKLPWTRTATQELPDHVQFVRTTLKVRGLLVPRRLWRRLAQDGWRLNSLLKELNDSRQRHDPEMTPAQLAHAIAEVAQRDAARIDAPRGPRYTIRTALVLVALLAWYYERVPWFGRWQQTTTPSVTAANDLLPYQVIADEDVRVSPDRKDGGEADNLRKSVRGRYSTRTVRSGAVLRPDLLQDATSFPDLSKRAIATVRVRHADAILATVLPARVTLALPTADGALECPDAYLLAIVREPKGTSTATVALPKCAHDTMASLLAAHAVTLMWDRRH